MQSSCPCCGLPVAEGEQRCPLCDTRLVRPNLRRTLLWAFVVEEFLLVAALMLRRA